MPTFGQQIILRNPEMLWPLRSPDPTSWGKPESPCMHQEPADNLSTQRRHLCRNSKTVVRLLTLAMENAIEKACLSEVENRGHLCRKIFSKLSQNVFPL